MTNRFFLHLPWHSPAETIHPLELLHSHWVGRFGCVAYCTWEKKERSIIDSSTTWQQLPIISISIVIIIIIITTQHNPNSQETSVVPSGAKSTKTRWPQYDRCVRQSQRGQRPGNPKNHPANATQHRPTSTKKYIAGPTPKGRQVLAGVMPAVRGNPEGSIQLTSLEDNVFQLDIVNRR